MLIRRRVLFLVLTLAWPLAAEAADWIRTVGVSQPQKPGLFERRGLKKAAQILPPDQAEALLERTTYDIHLENTSADKYCTSVRLEVRYLGAAGEELGGTATEVAVDLKPHIPQAVSFLCPDAACREAVALEVRSVEPLEFRTYEDRWIEIDGRTWHVLDEWSDRGQVTLLPFSPGYYDNKPFDDRMFTGESFWIDSERTFRIESVPIPASRPYPEGDIAWYSAAGLVVRDGVAEKPGFLKAPGRIINTNVHGELPVGQFVRIESAEVWGKKLLGLHLEPICRLSPGQRQLNSWLYFRFDPPVIKKHDTSTAEAAVRRFLRPASLREVSALCGPKYGTLVHRLTAATTEDAARAILGTPDARRETGGVMRLAYGSMELRFRGGAFAGVNLDR